ncbi:Hemolysin-type calcium-binding repeat-containing protein [Gemmobacter megaterium]|uniref:Hemolysin-type calcium-binding repeat-containing protein n=1 Tax=Gemmobacter megaterium TaxID=1086013 RepID=A0A1N7QH31_9RHOB|nr:calcium-binding protein [Gemmobacter megaterium]SIT21807.1 Hemolysin-type calcium-binding repeat-containing protein [Gemmobacter megaterium]
MTILNVNTAIAPYLDALFARIGADKAGYELHYPHADRIDDFFDYLDDNDATLSELSAARIVLSARFDRADWALTLAGSGIGPVSSIEALAEAIDEGLAQGRFSELRLDRNGSALATISFSETGYTLTSGGESLAVTGSLPASFPDLFRLAGYLERIDDLDDMNGAQRARLFSDLAAFGITGMEVSNTSRLLLAWSVTDSTATLRLPGLTLTAEGTFPADFGALLAVLYQVARLEKGGPADLTAIDGLALDRIVLTGDTGTVLLEATDIDNADLSSVAGILVDGAESPFQSVILGEGFVQSSDRIAENELILGTGGNDWLEGGGGRDRILGNDGHDSLFGGSGNDTLDGGKGNDWLRAGTGNDWLYGGDGNDNLLGQGGSNRLFGGAGRDTVAGGRGNDTIYGGDGDDRLTGGDSADRIYGDAGKDWLEGNDGNDRLYGGKGNDSLYGGAGTDRLFGGKGNDRLYGNGDLLYGGNGDDRLFGGNNSTLEGGAGADLFIFTRFSGRNVVTDYTDGTDRIRIDWKGIQGLDDLKIDTVAAGTRLRGDGNTVILQGVSQDVLDASDFLFG